MILLLVQVVIFYVMHTYEWSWLCRYRVLLVGVRMDLARYFDPPRLWVRRQTNDGDR